MMIHSSQLITDNSFRNRRGYVGTIASYLVLGLIVVGISFLLVACASAPPEPKLALQAADLAITTAEQARVADYAAPELGEARNKLADARAATAKKNMVVAQRLAEQAKVSADIATAKAGVAKAMAVNLEMQKSTSTLKTEMQRNPGVQ